MSLRHYTVCGGLAATTNTGYTVLMLLELIYSCSTYSARHSLGVNTVLAWCQRCPTFIASLSTSAESLLARMLDLTTTFAYATFASVSAQTVVRARRFAIACRGSLVEQQWR